MTKAYLVRQAHYLTQHRGQARTPNREFAAMLADE